MAGLQLDGAAAARDLAQQLNAAADEVTQLQSVHDRVGALVASAPAPRRSGRLAASVRADATTGGVVIASPLRYFTFVHWGAPRRHIVARPWLLTQLERQLSAIETMYADHIDTLQIG